MNKINKDPRSHFKGRGSRSHLGILGFRVPGPGVPPGEVLRPESYFSDMH